MKNIQYFVQGERFYNETDKCEEERHDVFDKTIDVQAIFTKAHRYYRLNARGQSFENCVKAIANETFEFFDIEATEENVDKLCKAVFQWASIYSYIIEDRGDLFSKKEMRSIDKGIKKWCC